MRRVAAPGAGRGGYKEAINEVAPLAPAAEVRRAVRDLSRAATTLDGLAASEERGERHALREGEACLVGFHPHGVVPFDAALATLRWPCGKRSSARTPSRT